MPDLDAQAGNELVHQKGMLERHIRKVNNGILRHNTNYVDRCNSAAGERKLGEVCAILAVIFGAVTLIAACAVIPLAIAATVAFLPVLFTGVVSLFLTCLFAYISSCIDKDDRVASIADVYDRLPELRRKKGITLDWIERHLQGEIIENLPQINGYGV